jgi:hypothetical protein
MQSAIRRIFSTAISQHDQQSNLFHLGLDVSSRCTGYTVMSPLGKAIECGVLDTSHVNHDIHTYGQYMHSFFQQLKQKFTLESKWIVGIEDYHMKFGPKSSAATLFKLSHCNVLCCYEAKNVLPDAHIVKSHVLSARSMFDISKSSSSTTNVKEHVFNLLSPALPPSYSIQTFKRNGIQKLSQKNYDVTDSLLIALHSYIRYHTETLVSSDENLMVFIDGLMNDKTQSSKLNKKLIEYYKQQRVDLLSLGVDNDDLDFASASGMIESDVMKQPLLELIGKELQQVLLEYLVETNKLKVGLARKLKL